MKLIVARYPCDGTAKQKTVSSVSSVDKKKICDHSCNSWAKNKHPGGLCAFCALSVRHNSCFVINKLAHLRDFELRSQIGKKRDSPPNGAKGIFFPLFS